MIAVTWLVPLISPSLATVSFYDTPRAVTMFLGYLQPTSFMGIELAGQWWLIVYYLGVAMLANIVGEELLWRGYILPRQEIVHGRSTWIVHGLLWTAFHAFQITDLGAVLDRLPTMLALAFVCQYTRSTWPGIIGHFVGNSPILILIIAGVLG